MRVLTISLILFLSLCVPAFTAQHGNGSHGGGPSGGSRGAVTSPAPSGGHSGAIAGHSGEVRGGHQEVRGGQIHQGYRGRESRQGYRGGNWQGNRGGYNYARPLHMAPEHYNSYFGHEHPFRPWHSHPYLGYSWGWHNHPCFWYGGFDWGFSIWPYDVSPYWWTYDDPIYIVVENDTYYAKNDEHPGEEIPLTVATTEPTGTVKIVSHTKGESILIDKALAGYTGELKSFRLSAGPQLSEVKWEKYFGEDIMVIADHELTVEIPN